MSSGQSQRNPSGLRANPPLIALGDQDFPPLQRQDPTPHAMSTNPPVVRPRRRSRDPWISGQLQRIPAYQRYAPNDPMRQHTTAYYFPQQLMAVHQILAHPNELPSRATMQMQQALQQASVNDAISVVHHADLHPNPQSTEPTFQVGGSRPMDIRRQTYQNERLYANYDYETGKELGEWDQASNSRKVKFLCKHGGRQNNASPMYYNVARDQLPPLLVGLTGKSVWNASEVLWSSWRPERQRRHSNKLPWPPSCPLHGRSPLPLRQRRVCTTTKWRSSWHKRPGKKMCDSGEEVLVIWRASETLIPRDHMQSPFPMTDWPTQAFILATSLRCDRI